MVEGTQWIELFDGKQFSRILYTNPVCLLGTFKEKQKGQDRAFSNVMILSWLTATNNEGRFMFSLNRRRHSASILTVNPEFTLSIPVRGMEDLVCNVGSISGSFGSKFPSDYTPKLSSDATRTQVARKEPSSNRERKKDKRFSHGIPDLKQVPLGEEEGNLEDRIFCIAGTVAHLRCRAYTILDEPVIDCDHYLVLAEVKSAFVKESYWDAKKNLFRPSPGDQPCLKFFGSQQFGYVVKQNTEPDGK
jgi:flavin reductase (DIM6/NTAB) family NADH-FMN oxidoreductase RutF